MNHSLALLTDLYQLTMAYGYWKNGMTETESVFNLFFRKNPFSGGYSIACGLEKAIEFLENFQFSEDDIQFLRNLKGNNEEPLFSKDFLDYLASMKFSCDVYAIEEGTVVFPHEPLLRIHGPLIQCQLIETALLNIINFQTLIATKASRLFLAAKGETVLEFGLRRAQGVDGSLSASRAAYIGGCDATSNVLAAKIYGIPVKGTHAHSWVMSFDSELEAFEKYADAMPNNCVFLVDTYDTLEGVKNAINIGLKLKEKGYQFSGIRLDSGDLAYLSIEARKLLDKAGFTSTQIVASNDLDENIIETLKHQGAEISVWGVGTKLVTAYDQPALGGVYKLAAIKNEKGEWDYKVKLSEQAIKISNPGILQVKRYFVDNQMIADMIYDQNSKEKLSQEIIDPLSTLRQKKLTDFSHTEDLLVKIFEKGKRVYEIPPILKIKERVHNQLSMLHQSIKRFSNPHRYPVGLEKNLYTKKASIIEKLRNEN